MEMTKGKLRSTTESESDALLPPSPFTPDEERRELQRVLEASTLPTQRSQPINSASFGDNVQDFVATAIPIYSESFEENNLLPVARAAVLRGNAAHDSGIGGASPLSGSKEPHRQPPTKKEAERSSKYEDVIVEPLSTNGQTTSVVPDATSLQNYTCNAHQRTTASLLRQAQHKGEVESEIEKAFDSFARVTVDAMRQKTAMELKTANAIAAHKAGRVDEGLTVDDSIHTNYAYDYSTTREERTERDDPDFRPYGAVGADGKRGYEVAPYDTADYNIGEYDVTEYKSVYD
ncbi:hypothetical protein HJC23_005175 [Cyclotella cryptica]|uniref:Uncharacterized protein n=1 Tax=Cyclotella cryptica TaxID=29204 RepID=A0ABD3QGV2_9STRA|eukprot:CCRYP_005863-RA/>CCRYP_005863-RA protein AED:0.22 eAED:0.22 QI:0/-1/0/1/-1/1/1/0/289